MPSGKMSRRGLFRSGAALAAAGVSASIPESVLARACPGIGRQSIRVDRRHAAGELPRHLYHHHRIADPARGEARHGAGIARLRPHGRADGCGRAAPGGTDQGRMGHRHRGMRRGPDARHFRLHRRRRSGKDAARAQPGRAEERSGGAALFAQRIRPRRAHAGREDGGGGNRRAVRGGHLARAPPW